jgi:hypothetical protein
MRHTNVRTAANARVVVLCKDVHTLKVGRAAAISKYGCFATTGDMAVEVQAYVQKLEDWYILGTDNADLRFGERMARSALEPYVFKTVSGVLFGKGLRDTVQQLRALEWDGRDLRANVNMMKRNYYGVSCCSHSCSYLQPQFFHHTTPHSQGFTS